MVGCLFTQTEYSLLNNIISIKKLVSKAKEYNFSYLSIADDSMFGALKFYYECLDNGIKPILGLYASIESFNKQKTKILLYAINDLGYKNLLHISSLIEISDNGFVSLDALNENVEGLFAVTTIETDIYSFLSAKDYDNAKKALTFFRSIFKKIYLGYMPQSFAFETISEQVVSLAKDFKLNLLPIDRSLYVDKNDEETYRYFKSLETGILLNELDGDYHFKNALELEKEFFDKIEIFDELNRIVSNVKYDIKPVLQVLPTYLTPNNIPSSDYLKDLALFGLEKRLKNEKISDKKNYQERLFYELDVIKKMKYDDYFLIVWDFILFAKKNKINVGPGRGSAAGSLVSYSLGITDINPVKYNLLFERFLNPERVSMPDIDTDFPDDKREDVIKYVSEKYGIKHVAHIITFGTFQAKLALRDMARAMKLPSYKLDNVLKFIQEKEDLLNYEKSDQLAVMAVDDKDIARLLRMSRNILDLPKNTSVHAAGIILSDCELSSIVPLSKGMNGIYKTQYEADDLKHLGILKMDFLGIRNLKIIDNIVNKVKAGNSKFVLSQIPLDEPSVYSLLSEAQTNGIFQLESPGIKKCLLKLKPNDFEDIVAILALYRPGPMDNIDEYVARKNGKSFNYFHEDLKAILGPTYGIIVYQEQVMQIVQIFAGYSLGEADILRRAMGKKSLEIMTEERTKFVSRAIKKGYDEKTADSIYDYIVKFANYGFNRSHSVAYAMISYQMAYFKAKYPMFFYTELLNNSIGTSEGTSSFIQEAVYSNIKVLPPNINYSLTQYQSNKSILMPFTAIKGIGEIVAKEIIQERQKGLYKSFDDFKNRVSLNPSVLQALIFSGAFDCFGKMKKELVYLCSKENVYDAYISDEIKESIVEFDFNELMDKEKEYLGLNINYLPLSKYAKLMKAKGYRDISSISDLDLGKEIVIIGIVKKIKEILTKNNEQMAFLSLTNGIIEIDGIIFTKEYKIMKEKLKKGVMLIRGTIDNRNSKFNILISDVKEEMV